MSDQEFNQPIRNGKGATDPRPRNVLLEMRRSYSSA